MDKTYRLFFADHDIVIGPIQADNEDQALLAFRAECGLHRQSMIDRLQVVENGSWVWVR